MIAELKKYPVQIPISIAWGEMDAFQHVNNVVYFKYFEAVRIKYFEVTGFFKEMEKENAGPILAQTACQYKLPLTYPDELIVGTGIKSIGRTSCVMEYAIYSKKLDKIAATGQGVIVMINYKTGEKKVIPEAVKQRMVALENKVDV
ncbi:MAG: acyl-CoA thioesterase [Chitinophagales bacterium]